MSFVLGFLSGIAFVIVSAIGFARYLRDRPYMPGPFERRDWE